MQRAAFLMVVLFLLLSSSRMNYGQFRSFSFERLTLEDGLSNSSINCILQTRDGFLWIATKDGLNRFDGQSFKIFKNISGDSSSLPQNYVMSLLESKDGTFWVGTWGGGLCKFDANEESFTKYDLASPEDDYIQCLFEDSGGNIWYGTTTSGLHKLNPKTKKITSLNSKGKGSTHFPADNITYITQDKNAILWIGTWDAGLIQYDPKAGRYHQYRHKAFDDNSIANDGIWNIYFDGEHSLWLSTFSGVDLFDITTAETVHQPYLTGTDKQMLTTTIRQIIKDSFGKLWVGTYDYRGLFALPAGFENKGAAASLFAFRNEEDNPNSLSTDRIRWLYEDRNQNLWIGTEDGLNKLPATKSFIQYRHFPIRPTSLGGKVVSSICEGKNNMLWVGYGGGGFDKINLSKNSITHFNRGSAKTKSLSNYDIISMHEDDEGILWLGTFNGGLNRFDPKTEDAVSFMHKENDSLSIKSNWVQQVIDLDEKHLLVGSNDGLQIFTKATGTFVSFRPELKPGSLSLPSNLTVNALLKDKDDNIWIGTWLYGLYRYNPNEKRFTHFMPEPKNANSISASKITALYEDSHGYIWICTHSGGLNKYDKTKNCFYHFTTHNGLPNDVVFGALEDDRGNMWISTLNGLAKLNPVTNFIRVYDVFDGLVNNQFNWRASCKSSKGILYFGGTNGFVAFNPDSISVDKNPPPVALTSFRVFDREAVLPQSLVSTKEILLNYNQNFISIEFAALDLAPSQKHKYAFKLNGVDPEWVNAGTRTIAYYTGLQQGKYTFLVKASNADNVWSKPISLSVIVLPAWWMTWWFRTIIVFLLLTLGFFIYEYRVNQLLKIERIRYNIASDLHDEIGSNLSSISVDGQMLLRSSSLNDADRELSRDISKTAMETIDAMRDIIWFINPKNDTGEDIILKMKEVAAKLLNGKEWTFEYSPGIRIDHFSLEERRNIFLIYKEALTNIVRHAEAKHVSIALNKGPHLFDMIITDDGKGFDKQHVKQNYGLLSIQKRADNIKALLSITSEVGRGTSVELKIHSKKK